MARLASRAVAGYFPAPPSTVLDAARLIELGEGTHAVLDPCAGEGAALFALLGALPGGGSVEGYGCEMEKRRLEVLRDGCWGVRRGDARVKVDYAWGDAFALDAGPDEERVGATVLWLNPPYDEDAEAGTGARLEARWLRRFGPCLAPGGVLLLLVPHRALGACAPTLARDYEDVGCWRLADDLFALFGQVLLIARRRRSPLFEPSSALTARVSGWGADPSGLPVLGDMTGFVHEVWRVRGLPEGTAGFSSFAVRALDLGLVRGAVAPWTMTVRGGVAPVPGVVPELPFADLIARCYPLAAPPRPAHIAAGIAAGAYNGAWLQSGTPGLPPVLVKGSFRKKFTTIEEKYDADGELTGEVQAQVPELQITILDPAAGEYVDLRSDLIAADKPPPLSEFSVGDLLRHYGASMLEVLRRQCPALHDPARDEAPQPEVVGRELYRAQRHAHATLRKLVERDRAGLVLGEIGVGKSTVAVATFAAGLSRRPIVFCPPHLAHKSWPDQVRSCLGERARVVVLDSIPTVDRHARDDDPGTVVAVLSREAAKLGHAWRGVEAGWASGLGSDQPGPAGRGRMTCPRCGAPTPVDERTGEPLAPEVLARRRMRCAVKRRVPEGAAGRLVEAVAAAVAPSCPGDDWVLQHAPRVTRLWCERLTRSRGTLEDKLAGSAVKPGIPWDAARLRPAVVPLVRNALRGWRDGGRPSPEGAYLLAYALHALGDGRLARRAALVILWVARAKEQWSDWADAAAWCLRLLPDSEVDAALALAERWGLVGMKDPRHNHWGGAGTTFWMAGENLVRENGGVRIGKAAPGSLEAARALAEQLAARAGWEELPPCGEPLYQAIPKPRRYPLAHYIRQRYRGLFDFLVIDEAHETSHGESAQSLAAMQLVNLGVPTVALTGSVMNGYAASLFPILWALNRRFREEYDRDELTRFVKEWGYVKRFIDARGREVEQGYGAQTDRREGGKVLGQVPGVSPELLLKHLLPCAVPIALSDMDDQLPPVREIVVRVEAETDRDRELVRRYQRMESDVRAAIRRDRFVKGRAGKLFGALGELASYPDRASCDTGNEAARRPNAWEVRYPPPVGDLVASAEAFPADWLLPKERELVRTAWRERAEGRRMIVFVRHVALMERVARLLAELTEEPAAVLRPEKVPTARREDWLDREVVGKGVPWLVTNPICVQTGLNCLCPWFSSVWWHEDPACNPIVRRQANGRVRRIGQREEARFYSPLVADTLQPLVHQLMLTKQGISESVDGLDASAAFEAAGAGDGGEAFAGRQLGAILFEMLEAGGRGLPPG